MFWLLSRNCRSRVWSFQACILEGCNTWPTPCGKRCGLGGCRDLINISSGKVALVPSSRRSCDCMQHRIPKVAQGNSWAMKNTLVDWLSIIAAYTGLFIGDYDNPLWGSYRPTSIMRWVTIKSWWSVLGRTSEAMISLILRLFWVSRGFQILMKLMILTVSR